MAVPGRTTAKFTFAVVGHNEAPLLANALGQATEAAQSGEPVWFVDSASTDDSAAIAAALEVEVVDAPLGKGRAVARAIDLCQTEYICLLDADIESSTTNIPGALRAAVETTRADMVVGEFVEPARRIRTTRDGLYRPLVETFFPEARDYCASTPLSGFRAVSLERRPGRLPPGFGVEAHLNVAFAAAGRSMAVADLGEYRGPIRPSRSISRDVAQAILDLAVEHGRLSMAARGPWDAWAADVVDTIATRPEQGPLDEFRQRLEAVVATRPEPGSR
jgi:hypothetical protein